MDTKLSDRQEERVVTLLPKYFWHIILMDWRDIENNYHTSDKLTYPFQMMACFNQEIGSVTMAAHVKRK